MGLLMAAQFKSLAAHGWVVSGGSGLRVGRDGFVVALLLTVPHTGINAVAGEEVAVTAAFDDTPSLQHQNLVGINHGRQPVGDHKGGSALGDVVEVVGDGLLHIEFGVRLQSLQDRDRR